MYARSACKQRVEDTRSNASLKLAERPRGHYLPTIEPLSKERLNAICGVFRISSGSIIRDHDRWGTSACHVTWWYVYRAYMMTTPIPTLYTTNPTSYDVGRYVQQLRWIKNEASMLTLPTKVACGWSAVLALADLLLEGVRYRCIGRSYLLHESSASVP